MQVLLAMGAVPAVAALLTLDVAAHVARVTAFDVEGIPQPSGAR